MFRSILTGRRRSPLAALWTVFFLNGAVLSSWAPRIPEVAARLEVTDAALGAALFGVAAGSVPALLLTGRLLLACDSRRMCIAAAAAFAAALPLISLASTAIQLGLILALLGLASGALDIAMNTVAIEYQRMRGTAPVISRLHGGYSLGVLAGATGGAVATIVGVSVAAHLLSVTGVLSGLLLAAARHVPRRCPPSPAGAAIPGAHTSMLRTLTCTVAALAIAGLLIEGMLTDWAALLVSRDLGAGAGAGSTVVGAFSLAMFVSRSTGDWIVPRLGRHRYLMVVAIGAAAGTSMCLFAPSWVVAYAGVVLVGIVLGPVFPLAIAIAAERTPGTASTATAAVSAVGYCAYLGGPPLIGMAADGLGLPLSIAVFGAGCSVAITAAALGLRNRAREPRSRAR